MKSILLLLIVGLVCLIAGLFIEAKNGIVDRVKAAVAKLVGG